MAELHKTQTGTGGINTRGLLQNQSMKKSTRNDYQLQPKLRHPVVPTDNIILTDTYFYSRLTDLSSLKYWKVISDEVGDGTT